jgi:hypothetical protein
MATTTQCATRAQLAALLAQWLTETVAYASDRVGWCRASQLLTRPKSRAATHSPPPGPLRDRDRRGGRGGYGIDEREPQR